PISEMGDAESFTIFDNVFVPRERVFLDGKGDPRQTPYAGFLALLFAHYHRHSYTGCKPATSEVLASAAALVAEYNGIQREDHVRDKISHMIGVAELVFAAGQMSAYRAERSSSGTYIPDEILTNAIRLYQPPAAPVLANPGATISGFQVPLNWTVPSDTDGEIVEYIVQASSSASFTIIGQSATVTTTTHAFTFLSNGTYYFRVRAIDNNTLAGPWSNVVSTYIELPPITFPGIPGFPLEAIAIGLLLSLSVIFVIRRRKQQQVSS
ncbi:MAG: Loki-CTERM sorting domain-containing protein, partial [Candidatus Hermodarchaeota archaeon]|nr:Loki-CTERM sorting domain-containing protein [Candidatus Hermodarchaeota archaeon]